MVWTDLTVSLIRDDDGRPRFTVAMIEDITERYELQQRLRFQALHDPLTGLPNRTLFFETARPRSSTTPGAAPAGRGLLPRPGRLQGDQRQPRPRPRRPAAGDGRPAAAPRASPAAATWSPGWAATSSSSWSTDGDGTDDAVAVAEAALAAVAAPVRVGEHQLAVSASIGIVERPVGGTTAVGADAGRRHHAATGRRRRAGAAGRSTTRSAAPGTSPGTRWPPALPGRAGPGRVRACDYQPIVSLLDGRDARRGGAGPLAAPGAGRCSGRTGSSGWPRRPA